MDLLVTAARFGVECLGYAGSIGEFQNIDAFSKPLGVVASFEAMQTGVVSVDGKMVDKPVYEQARALCQREI